jgi:integrase
MDITLHPMHEPARRDRDPSVVYIASLARGSRKAQSGALKAIASFLGVPRAIAWHELRSQHTMAVRAWLLEADYAPKTVVRFLSALRGVLRMARRMKLLSSEDYELACDLPPVKGSRVRPGRSLASTEMRALFDSCEERGDALALRNAAMIGLLYGVGVRRAEVCSIDVEDLRGVELVVRGKGNKERQLFLPAGAVRAVAAWLEVRGDGPGPLLVPVPQGHRGELEIRRLSEKSVLGILKRLRDCVGLEKFTTHDFRRTWIGDLLDANVQLTTIQDLAGHASPVTTSQYDRRGERARRSAADHIVVPFRPQ